MNVDVSGCEIWEYVVEDMSLRLRRRGNRELYWLAKKKIGGKGDWMEVYASTLALFMECRGRSQGISLGNQ